MDSDADEFQICLHCIGETYLKEIVRMRGHRETCAICQSTAVSLSAGEYADLIRPIVESHFESAAPEYTMGQVVWPRGMTNVELIGEITRCDDYRAAELILASLRQRWESDPSEMGEDPLDDDLRYRLNPLLSYSGTGWDAIEKQLRTKSRYFNPTAEVWLHDLFTDIDKLINTSGEPVVRIIGPTMDVTTLWRVRLAADRGQAEMFLANPELELGPPPSQYASSGRMNAAGISVFYGAEDIATCIAEVRAPVGSVAVAAPFEVVRALRLLDLPALVEAHAGTLSLFDPDYAKRHARVARLRDLSYRLQQPTLPSEESSRYLPTQMVAEYLASRCSPPFDGVIYASTQAGGRTRNVVLFQHASKLVALPANLRRTINCETDWETGQLSLHVNYEDTMKREGPDSFDSWDVAHLFGSAEPQNEPALRLNCSDVKLVYIQAVTHKFQDDEINWKEQSPLKA